ncbi:hypothetical protein Vadar_027460 [Vaccinium darrowii]|uniref:Uncharacterized protein n=1 Tax=Vaccinium darrowii TaxID=229202 RepID=A0ACB7XKC0_9ERIC|nr:hypothetical protein Vadar_027460 [Vaccinium darrowii]
MGDIAVDIFQETLKELITSSKLSLINKEKHQLQSLEEEIKYLRGFLKDTEKKRDNHPEVMKLVMEIRDLISEAENIVELFVVHAYIADLTPYSRLEDRLESVNIRMMTLEAKVWIEENSEGGTEFGGDFTTIQRRPRLQFTQQTEDFQWSHTSEMVKGKVVVGFKEEVQKLIEKLDGGEGKPLEIISIIGSSRGGKTTVAREVYNHPYTSHVFEICAWINVSQNYDQTMKRDLLIRILESAIPKKHKDYKRYSDDKLGVEIFKYLKGRKYLIVMDDMWGIEAWNDIQKSFPKEHKGSKVLFTTQLHVQLDSVSYIPNYLAPLPNWCWELLQKKDTFDWLKSHYYNSSTFRSLQSRRYGRVDWIEILERINEYSNDGPAVTRLLMEITDLVAEAENMGELFVVHAFEADDVPYYLLEPDQDHLSLETIKKEMKTLIAEVKKIYDKSMYDMNGVATKLLKHSSTGNGGIRDGRFRLPIRVGGNWVLNFLSGSCSGEIGRGRLVHLRYLAYKSDGIHALPFSYLLNLETLNLKSTEKVIELPCDIFKMVKLRHLYTKNGVFNFHRSRGEEESIGFDRSSKLDSLQTLHQICACEHCRSFLVRTPNLKKLGLYNERKGDNNVMRFPELEYLKGLEKLTFTFHYRYQPFVESTLPFVESTLPPGLKLPPTITRITLKMTRLKWEELSLLQTLPSLEVLKLMESACSGPVWNTSELDGFPQLKYLRFSYLDIMEWIAFEDQFSKLEVLVLEGCYKLERIPNDFGNLNDLREIKLEMCRRSAEQSAKEIQEEQINRKGDDDCLNLLTKYNFF